MSLLELFLLAVSLSMDAFAVSVCKGLAAKEYKFRYSLICGAWFGFFQGLMPAVGYLLGVNFADKISSFDHWIVFVLLGFIGFNMIKEALSKDDEDEETDSSFAVKNMFLLAIATSIDALAVGVSFAFLKVNIVSAVLFIGVCTFLISGAGVKIGSVFGTKYKSKAELAGGIILMLLGIKILAEHLLGA
ncbi:MAG: manganese efflux pump MntP family protein [Huintestinicola sp.]